MPWSSASSASVARSNGYERRVTTKYYEAGHMMYIRRADHVLLKKDLVEFIAAATGGG